MYNTTDLGNSERFVAAHGGEVKYVREWGWLVYDGKRWAKVDESAVIELAKATVRKIEKEAVELESDTERRQLLDWAVKSEAGYRLEQMVKLSKGALYAEASDFDRDTWLLNVEDGTIDLRTGELRDHAPEDMITKLAPVEYEGESDGKRWEAFLREIFNNDEGLIDYVQRAIGLSLTGQTTEDVFFVAHGSGRNGKSTLFGILQTLLGDYASTASSNLILSQGNFPKQSYDLASLIGTRFVTVYETELDKKLDLSTVKQLTGGDMMTAAAKYEKPVTFRPQLKLFLSTNNKPEVNEASKAIWARIKLIPFDVTFEGERMDTELEEKLQAELPAILRWAVEGTLKWQANGLSEPESVLEATRDYREESDDLAAFINDKCATGTNTSVKASELFKAYENWLDPDVRARQEGMTSTAFSTEIKRRYRSKRARGGVTYVGVGLKEEPGDKILRSAFPQASDEDDIDLD